MALKQHSMYGRRSASVDVPGRWITDDGEYEFVRVSPDGWRAFHRAHFNVETHRFETLAIGTRRTLDDVFALASRHYMTPAGEWDAQS
jgi:hypothetical protein